MNGIIYKVTVEAISRGHDNIGLKASRELDIANAEVLREIGKMPEYRALIDEISTREKNLVKDGLIALASPVQEEKPVFTSTATPAPVIAETAIAPLAEIPAVPVEEATETSEESSEE